MSKRFHDTEIWKQDWFLEMPYEYKLLWFYVKDTCDHAGIWKPNTKFVEFIAQKPIDLKIAYSLFNSDKDRIDILPNSRWLISEFIPFQYGNHLNPNNRVHQSVLELLNVNEVKLTSIRGLIDLKDRVKDKDKDKDKDKSKDKIILDLTTYNWLNITPEHRELWHKAYPAVNIDQELAKMASWIKANPDRKKIRWERFITNWLSRAQDVPRKEQSNANTRMGKAIESGDSDKFAGLPTIIVHNE